jgi:hypothetical protein
MISEWRYASRLRGCETSIHVKRQFGDERQLQAKVRLTG